jgi:arylsulfate sulfotransferase
MNECISLTLFLGACNNFGPDNARSDNVIRRSCHQTVRDKKNMNTDLRIRVTFCSTVVFTLMTLGCGTGTNTGVAATQNPLVAQYVVLADQQGATAWVEFGTDTTYGRQTSTIAATTSPEAITILIAGMRPNTTYHMRAHLDGNISWVDQDRTFTTGPLGQGVPPSSFAAPPKLTITRPTPGLSPQPGVELIDALGPANTPILGAFATDLDGNIIWYYDPGVGHTAVPWKLLPNGNIGLINGNGSGSQLMEVDLAGNTIRQLTTATLNQRLAANGYSIAIANFHHEILPLPNGHWIVLANTTKPYTNLPGYPGTTEVLGDFVIDLDPNWNPVWAWSSFDHLDINRHPYLFPDWTHSNALVYLPDGNLLLSVRHQSWVLKLDYENGVGKGDILWRLGYQGDFTLAQGDPTQWFFAQHFPSLVASNGSQLTLAVMDNGDDRVVDGGGTCNPYSNPNPCYSRAVILDVDQDAKSASLAWNYDPAGVYSYWGGSILELENKDVEFDMTDPFNGPSSRVMEIAPGESQQIVWQLDIAGGNAYRAYRIPSLYPGVSWEK